MKDTDGGITEQQIFRAPENFDALWDELFPAEQQRLIQLLIQRVVVHKDRLQITLYTLKPADIVRTHVFVPLVLRRYYCVDPYISTHFLSPIIESYRNDLLRLYTKNAHASYDLVLYQPTQMGVEKNQNVHIKVKARKCATTVPQKSNPEFSKNIT